MNCILGIDTSSADLGIGIYRNSLPVASYSRFIGNSHAEHISPVVKMLLDLNSVSTGTLDGIAVAVGPGSFTGLRIGISFIKGFCIGTGIPVLPLSSLFILAHAAIHHTGRVVAAIDARNDDVFYAMFSASEKGITRLSDDTTCPSKQFFGHLQKDDIIVTDTIGFRKSTVFSPLKSDYTTLSVEKYHLQRGLLCAAAGSAEAENPCNWQPSTEIEPNYLRRSAPEERRRKRGTE
jgi:tRNA threonylcarbamoyladenosine biosynthesis protein TsaB